MRTFVTGASGLVGGNLVRALVLAGRGPVRVCLRATSRPVALDGLDGVERVEGDVRDPASLERAMVGCEAAYHCAASVTMWTPTKASRETMHEVNVTGTRNVLAAAQSARVRRVVHVSTVDALGLRSREDPADEGVPFDPIHQQVPYMRTKWEAERVALRFASEGLDVVVVNPTFMFGAFDAKPTSGQMIVAVAKGLALTYPSAGGNNFVDVEDVVAGMISAMERGRPGERYILGGVNLTYREILTRIAGIVGARPPRWPVPSLVAAAAGHAGDLWGRFSGREPVVHSTTARLGYVDHYFTPAKAIRELSLPQTPIEQAIRRAYEWFRARGSV